MTLSRPLGRAARVRFNKPRKAMPRARSLSVRRRTLLQMTREAHHDGCRRAGRRVAIGSKRYDFTAIGIQQYLLAGSPQYISATEGSDVVGLHVELGAGRGAVDFGK